jgi:hypothetical protein
MDDLWVAGWIPVFLAPATMRQGELIRAHALLEDSVVSRRRLNDRQRYRCGLAPRFSWQARPACLALKRSLDWRGLEPYDPPRAASAGLPVWQLEGP